MPLRASRDWVVDWGNVCLSQVVLGLLTGLKGGHLMQAPPHLSAPLTCCRPLLTYRPPSPAADFSSPIGPPTSAAGPELRELVYKKYNKAHDLSFARRDIPGKAFVSLEQAHNLHLCIHGYIPTWLHTYMATFPHNLCLHTPYVIIMIIKRCSGENK